MKGLTHISLFSGIGGIDLATEWAGFKTILFVEIDKYCQKVLRKHWPDVPIIGDIKDVTKEAIAYATSQRPHNQENKQKLEEEGGSELHIEQSRIDEPRKSERAPLIPITLITGGFPCQPVSQAGQRRGKEDDRWLWPDMLRVISEVRPTWVVAENVTGLLTMGFYDCLSNLEGQGYETIPFVIPACGVNAPHRRDRIFIVAHDDKGRLNNGRSSGERIQGGAKACDEIRAGNQDVANTKRKRLEGADTEGEAQAKGCSNECSYVLKPQSDRRESGGCQSYQANGWDWWAAEPDVGRVAYGIPNRVDRLKCLGNAVVPAQIYPILKAIADIERHKYSLENTE